MAGENTTLARPYAQAIFRHATAEQKLDLWSEMLAFLAQVVTDQRIRDADASPHFSRTQMTELMLEVAGGRLNETAENLVRLLVANRRLRLLPEIALLYDQLMSESQGVIAAHVRSAFALNQAQQNQLAELLKGKLGREVTITAEKDPALIGGVHIRAGDLVIDGSVQGRLQKLAHELAL